MLLTKSPFNGWGLKTIKVLSPHPNLHISPFACFQNQTKIFSMRCFWLPMPSSMTAFCPSSWLSRSLINWSFNWSPKIFHTFKLFWIWKNIVCIPKKKVSYLNICFNWNWSMTLFLYKNSNLNHGPYWDIYVLNKTYKPSSNKIKKVFFLFY